MKTIKPTIVIAVVLVLCVVNISSAGNCKNAEELLSKAVSTKPDAMTEKKIKTAISQCPDNPSLYERAGDYYRQWYENETDEGLKDGYKQLAIENYKQGVAYAVGNAAERM